MINLAGHVVLGGAQFSIGPSQNDDVAVATIQAAASAGIRIFDSARAYAPPLDPTHNEQLFARALAPTRGTLISTKGGHFRKPDGRWAVDNRPSRLRADVEMSLGSLRVERLELYFLHRADDSTVPLEESIGALDALRREGKIAQVGISNATVAQLSAASRVTSIDAVQNQLTLDDLSDEAVLWCERHEAAFFAYSPFGGPNAAAQLRRRWPHLTHVADEMGVSLHRLVLSGILAVSNSVSVIAGAGRPQTAMDSAGASAGGWTAAASAARDADRSSRS